MPAGERFLKFERPILDQFGIEAAVSAKVDVFEENSIHGRGDGSAGVRRIHGDHDGVGRVLAEKRNREECKEEEAVLKSSAHRCAQC